MEKVVLPAAATTVVVLNSGRRIPVLGLGTAADPPAPPPVVESAVLHAIELGYRHIDTASIYETEGAVGRAVARAVERGLVDTRDDLFVTSKLACADMDPHRVLPALRQTLEVLGLEYVDLYLVHFPIGIRVKSLVVSSNDVFPVDMKSVWLAMEECYRLGLAKSIGVSNFTCAKLNQLLLHANVPPAVNQVEMHPLWQQSRLREFCKEKGIHVSAHSPLGGSVGFWGSDAVRSSEVIKQIAQAKGKTVAQVCLRWAFEQGVSFLPKSFNKQRIQENMEIFDWQLSKVESEKLQHLPQARVCRYEVLVSPNGPYKTLEELWDGEI